MNTDGSGKNQAGRGGIRLFVWRHLPQVALAGLALLIIVLFIAVQARKSALEKEKAAARIEEVRPVNTVLLELQPITITDGVNLPGIIEPWIRLELMARVSGSIVEVTAREGQTVAQGEVLARIEAADYRIALEAASAAHTQARADYERSRIMFDKKTISRAQLELSEAQMLAAKAQMEEARLRLSRTEITAPMSGILRRLDAEVGLFLNVGDPVAEILQIDRVKAVVGIPESDVTAVRTLSEVEVAIQALDGLRVTGRTLFLSPSPDSAARLYRLELALDNPEHLILPGMFFRAMVIKKRVAGAVAVPLYSVITRGGEQFVFIDRDGTARKQPVSLGITEHWQVQITEGLAPGDRVVVEGHRELEDGQPINVIQVITEPGAFGL